MPDMPITPNAGAGAPIIEQNTVKMSGGYGRIILEIPKTIYDEQISFLERVFSADLKKEASKIDRMRRTPVNMKKMMKNQALNTALTKELANKPQDFLLKKLLSIPGVRQKFIETVVYRGMSFRSQDSFNYIIKFARESTQGREALMGTGMKFSAKTVSEPREAMKAHSRFDASPVRQDSILEDLRSKITRAQDGLEQFRKNLTELPQVETRLDDARRVEAEKARIAQERIIAVEDALAVKSIKIAERNEASESLKAARVSGNQDKIKRLEKEYSIKINEFTAAEKAWRDAMPARDEAVKEYEAAKKATNRLVKEKASIIAALKNQTEFDAERVRARSAREAVAPALMEKHERIKAANRKLENFRLTIKGLQKGLHAAQMRYRDLKAQGHSHAYPASRDCEDINRALTMEKTERNKALKELNKERLALQSIEREVELAGIYDESLMENKNQIKKWTEKGCAEELLARLDGKKAERIKSLESTKYRLWNSISTLRDISDSMKESGDKLRRAISEGEEAAKPVAQAKERLDAVMDSALSTPEGKEIARTAINNAFNAHEAADEKFKEALSNYETEVKKIEDGASPNRKSAISNMRNNLEDIVGYRTDIKNIESDKALLGEYIAGVKTENAFEQKPAEERIQDARAEIESARRIEVMAGRIAEEDTRIAYDIEIEGRQVEIEVNKALNEERKAREKKLEIERKPDALAAEKKEGTDALNAAEKKTRALQDRLNKIISKWQAAATKAWQSNNGIAAARKITEQREQKLQGMEQTETARARAHRAQTGEAAPRPADTQNPAPAKPKRRGTPSHERRIPVRRSMRSGLRCEVRPSSRGTITARIDAEIGAPAEVSVKAGRTRTINAKNRARTKAKAAEEAVFGKGRASNRSGSPAEAKGSGRSRGKAGVPQSSAPRASTPRAEARKVNVPRAPRVDVPDVSKIEIPKIPRVK